MAALKLNILALDPIIITIIGNKHVIKINNLIHLAEFRM